MAHESPELPVPPNTSKPNPPDLPNVEPPTAGFIVQLFLIPALIVAGIVVVWLLFGQIAAGNRTPEDFLSELRGTIREKRWNAARDLEFRLRTDKNLQSNLFLASGLAKLLEEELDKAPPKSGSQDALFLQYLTMALSRFDLDVGKATLRRVLESDFPSEVRGSAVLSLGRLAATLSEELDSQSTGSLIAAGNDSEPEIRKLAAYSLGSVATADSIACLQQMCQSESDWEIRFNAALSLAKQGQSEGLDIIAKMFDTDYLEQLSLNERQREVVPIAAIQALQLLLERSQSPPKDQVRDMLQQAKRSELISVRTRAQEVLNLLQ